MTKKTITQIILIADEDKYLTDGTTYVKSVRLPEGATGFNWYEISEDDYNKIQEETE
jgi:hypothetical protein